MELGHNYESLTTLEYITYLIYRTTQHLPKVRKIRAEDQKDLLGTSENQWFSFTLAAWKQEL